MKKYIILIVLSLNFIWANALPSPQETIVEGNMLYGKNQYDKAIEKYMSVLNQGYVAAELYYNLGNAYFKTEDYTQAIYYFEKSLKINPSDENASFNLKVCNTKIADKLEEVPQLFYVKWWTSLSHLMSLQSFTIIGIILFFLFFISLAIYLLSRTILLRKIFFFASIIFIFITIFTLLCAYSQYKDSSRNDYAIVFEPTLSVKSSPDEKGNDIFVIHQGLKVSLTDQIGEWSEIRLSNGSKGWVKSSTCKVI
ncbi:MAG: tetratricopeptide repeat protein [Bacteroidota bacterium]